MKKLLGLVCAGAVMAMMTGCGLGPTEEANITVTINSIGDVAVNSGAVAFTVKVESDSDITAMTYAVKQGTTDKTTDFTVTPPLATDYNGKKNVTLNFSIAAKSTATAGTYQFYAKVTASDINDDDSRDFTVSGSGGTPVATATLEAGANKNTTLGSSIDLDEPKVMLMAEANANVSKIDICYAYSGTDSKEKLFSPHHAKASSFTFALNWANPNETKFYKTSLTPAEYNAVTTKEQITALWTEPSAAATSLDCAANDVFIAKTDQAALVLILITSQTAGDAGKIDLKIAK